MLRFIVPHGGPWDWAPLALTWSDTSINMDLTGALTYAMIR